MTPTQAQIEAAAKAIYDNGSYWFDADVQTQTNYKAMARRALTAAAEAGEPLRLTQWDEIAATIERCAQELVRRAEIMQSLKLDYATVVASELMNAAAAIRAMANL